MSPICHIAVIMQQARRRAITGRRGKKARFGAVLVVGATLLLAGCAAPAGLAIFSARTGVAMGTGVDYTLNGIAYKTFVTPLPRARQATLASLNRMGMTVVEDKKSDSGWMITATAEGRDIDVELQRRSSTKPPIRSTGRGTRAASVYQTHASHSFKWTREAMMRNAIVYGALGSFLLMPAAWALSEASDYTAWHPTSVSTAANHWSSGQRSTGDAVGATAPRWDDQVTANRRGAATPGEAERDRGIGDVFRRMRTAGDADDRNHGAAVSGFHHELNAECQDAHRDMMWWRRDADARDGGHRWLDRDDGRRFAYDDARRFDHDGSRHADRDDIHNADHDDGRYASRGSRDPDARGDNTRQDQDVTRRTDPDNIRAPQQSAGSPASGGLGSTGSGGAGGHSGTGTGTATTAAGGGLPGSGGSPNGSSLQAWKGGETTTASGTAQGAPLGGTGTPSATSVHTSLAKASPSGMTSGNGAATVTGGNNAQSFAGGGHLSRPQIEHTLTTASNTNHVATGSNGAFAASGAPGTTITTGLGGTAGTAHSTVTAGGSHAFTTASAHNTGFTTGLGGCAGAVHSTVTAGGSHTFTTAAAHRVPPAAW